MMTKELFDKICDENDLNKQKELFLSGIDFKKEVIKTKILNMNSIALITYAFNIFQKEQGNKVFDPQNKTKSKIDKIQKFNY